MRVLPADLSRPAMNARIRASPLARVNQPKYLEICCKRSPVNPVVAVEGGDDGRNDTTLHRCAREGGETDYPPSTISV